MTLLVTGASGRIGRHVVRGLAGAGQRVRAMTRDPETARGLLPPGVEVVHGDFDRPETWAAALEGVERAHVFPFAPAAFLDAAARAGTRRFVVHSAVAAGWDGDRDDGRSPALRRHLAAERDGHREVELAAEATGAEWTHVRPGLLATGLLDWAEGVRADRAVRAPYPEYAQALVHEADVAEIAVAALLTDAHVGAAYTITGPAPLTQREQVRAIGAALGERVRFEELTPEQARQAWRDPDQGVDDAVLDWLLDLMAYDGPVLVPPTTTFQRLTGRAPRSVAQWARDHVEDFR
ncbi:SDR family oxidoreductase [Nonomuraea longicatena]|uniref:NAD(P)H-binding protein n=1 Tax=Nonomuraea longicatena TaxID=83682 RepID=A0ABP3Z4H2_9ACTN